MNYLINTIFSPKILKQLLFFCISTILLFFALYINIKGPYWLLLLGLFSFAVLVFIAYRSPLLTIFLLFLTGITPQIFQMTKMLPAKPTDIGGGFNAPDVVVLGMVVALIIKGLIFVKINTNKKTLGIKPYIILFIALILFEILRNITDYGLSAPGEFRYRYLILAIPLYVSQFFNSEKSRKRLLKMLIFCSVILTLTCIPIIGMIKGWSVGPDSRFLPSAITLGLVYGLLALLLAKKYAKLQLKNTLIWTLTCLVLTLVLIDSHRSVWISTIAIIITMFFLGEIKLTKIWKWGLPVLLAIFIVWQIVNKSGLDVLDYIKERGSEIVTLKEKSTAAWRVALWEAQFQKFLKKPILGYGFGDYWKVYVPQFKNTKNVSPHSLYVQSLVKIGILGLVIYLLIMFKLFCSFIIWLRRKKTHNFESAIAITGLVVLIASHVYYSVYAFEYYTMLFLGLGVATIQHEKQENSDKCLMK